MFIILADDQRLSDLKKAATNLFTEKFLNSNVFYFDVLLDAIYKIEDSEHIDVGLFDLDFKQEVGSAHTSSNSTKVRNEKDTNTQLMGINCLYIAIQKSKNFVGTLYTFHTKSSLRAKSLDLRVFIDYWLKQWEDEGRVSHWSGSEGVFSENAAIRIREMLRTARSRFFDKIDDPSKFRNAVESLLEYCQDRDISEEGIKSRIKEVKDSLKFKDGGRKFSFEEFYPEQEREFEELSSKLDNPSLELNDIETEKLIKTLRSLVIDWRPYTSLLSELVRPEGSYAILNHPGSKIEINKERIIRETNLVQEFEMLPQWVIDELDPKSNKWKRFKASELFDYIKDKLEEKYPPYNRENLQSLTLKDKKGVVHTFKVQFIDNCMIDIVNDTTFLALPCDVFINKICNLVKSEILRHGFSNEPKGCSQIPNEKKIITISLLKTLTQKTNNNEPREYVLTVADNGYGFSGSSFALRGSLGSDESLKEVRDWCTGFFIETNFCGEEGGRFKYDLLNKQQLKIDTPNPALKDTSGTAYSFVFHVKKESL